MLRSGRRGADPAGRSRHSGAAGPAEFPRVVGGGEIRTVWVPGWRRRSGKPVPALVPDPPLGGGGELRGWNPSGTEPQTFRAPLSFCLSWQRRRRLSCDPLVLASLAAPHRFPGTLGRGAGTLRVPWPWLRPPDARVREPAPRPDSSSRGDRAASSA